MNVNLNVYHNYMKAQELGTHSKEFGADALSVKQVDSKQDTVCISADATAYRTKDKAVKTLAAEVENVGNTQHLAALREKIKAGTYQISTGEVADAILSRVAG